MTGGASVAKGDSADEPVGFHTQVEVRWSDMDAFQHINNANMVTLLEEARIPWLFYDDKPTKSLRDGCVLVDLHVHYALQLRHDDTPLDIVMWVEQLRAVDFTVGYEVRPNGAGWQAKPSVTATSQLAAFDMQTQRLRRFTPAEKAYLASWKRD